mmetsp:Transcript_9399/g.34883  ORF Transcript_9399/g.34883 Transcript_9399/m.34883 type:complete len:733 (+) Transcript_9399:368-2566(+)|eukprot:CAMPEP_0117446712 /NCGR_PEP_ID=MMETSP0759-20121206/6490_1 /TAXON_ID=63605 /ORGANISM="Percolomonas cosmopolitus, Strain WS" /LENGTH=732 /DNA_ID=CAMNT_0005239003 /DNA_START=340 /DNA_END=2538 /DNA_ORIENTATION=-
MTFLARITKYIIGGAVDGTPGSDSNYLSQPFTFDDADENATHNHAAETLASVERYYGQNHSELPTAEYSASGLKQQQRGPHSSLPASILTDTSELSDDDTSNGILHQRGRSHSSVHGASAGNGEMTMLRANVASLDEEEFVAMSGGGTNGHDCYSAHSSAGSLQTTHILKQHARYMEMARSKLSGQHYGLSVSGNTAGGTNFPSLGSSAVSSKSEALFSEITLLTGHTNAVTKVLKIDDERVLSYSDDSTLIIWQVHTGRILKRLVGHKNRVTCALIMVDSSLGGFNSHTESVGSLTSTESGITDGAPSTATGITPDTPNGTLTTPTHHNHFGSSGAAPSANSVNHPNPTNSHHPNSNYHHINPPSLHQQIHHHQYNHKRIRIISGSADKTVRIWDTETGACLKELRQHESGVNCLCKLDKGHFCSVSDEICIWDLQGNRKSMIERNDDEHVHDMLPLPNNQIAVASCTLTVYNIHGEEDLESIYLKNQDTDIFTLLKITPETFVSASREGILSFWSTNSLQCTEKLNLRDYFTKDGKYQLTHVSLVNRYFLVCAFDKHFIVIHHSTRKPVIIRENAHDAIINKITFLSGRNLLVTCSDDSRIRLWKTHQTMNLSSSSVSMTPHSSRKLASQRHKKSNSSKTSLLSRRITRKRSRSVDAPQPIFFQDTNIVVAQMADELMAHTERCVDVLKLNDSELISAGGEDVLAWRDGNVARYMRHLYSWRFGTGNFAE